MAEHDEEREVGRFYTRSRRYPKFIGRLHDGTKIPGGPYTLTQGVVLGLMLIACLTTQSIWGTGSPIVDIPLAIGISWAAAWGAGRIPMTRRSLFSVVGGALSAMTRTGAGKYRGASFKLVAPHYAGGRTDIAASSSGATDAEDSPAATPSPSPLPAAASAPVEPRMPSPQLAPHSGHAVSGVERLLQQARGGS